VIIAFYRWLNQLRGHNNTPPDIHWRRACHADIWGWHYGSR